MVVFGMLMTTSGEGRTHRRGSSGTVSRVSPVGSAAEALVQGSLGSRPPAGRVVAPPRRFRLGPPAMARRPLRPGALDGAGRRGGGGTAPGRRARRARRHRHDARRSDAAGPRHAPPARRPPARRRVRRAHLVPAVQRAGRRVRPRRAAHHAPTRDGDQWVVNGQKVWTSGAHEARYGLLVARTRSDVPEAPWHHLLRDRHAPAGRRGQAAPRHHRPVARSTRCS